MSDLDMDDLAAVKLRAITPPWQRVEKSQWWVGGGGGGRG